MDTVFVVVLILFLVGVYGLLTYSLYITKILEAFVFEKVRGFFKKKRRIKMTIPRKLTQFLKRNKVHYEVLVHPKTFTSPETAQAGHIPGKAFAKVVVVDADGKDKLAVLPSTRTIDLFKLSTVLGTSNVHIEEEKEFKDLFWDCEAGAIPPVGLLYHIPCYFDESLKDEKYLYFNAGNHEECIKVATEDFLMAVHAVVRDFSVEGKKIHEKAGAAA